MNRFIVFRFHPGTFLPRALLGTEGVSPIEINQSASENASSRNASDVVGKSAPFGIYPAA